MQPRNLKYQEVTTPEDAVNWTQSGTSARPSSAPQTFVIVMCP